MKKLLFILFSSTFIISCSKVEFKDMSVSEAFSLAKDNNKKVFVFMGNHGCQKCDYYLKKLNRNSSAKNVLKKDFICIKLNQNDLKGKEFSRITGCAFFPYSCFFDADGNFLNLRIGDEEFNFSSLTKKEMPPFAYQELFKIPVSFENYKKRVSYSLQSYLLRNNSIGSYGDTLKAIELAQRSIDVHPYAYNLFSIIKLKEAVNDTLQKHYYLKLFKENYCSWDDYLFFDLRWGSS